MSAHSVVYPPAEPPLIDEAFRVGFAGVGQVEGGCDAVLRVDDAPLAGQQVAVVGSEPGAAAVVHIHDGDAARRPVLDAQVQRAAGRTGRAAVAEHDQRRKAPRRRLDGGVRGPEAKRVRLPCRGAVEGDQSRH